MAHRFALIAVAVAVTACSSSSGDTESRRSTVPVEASPTSTINAPTDGSARAPTSMRMMSPSEISAQIDTASRVVCELLDAADVQTTFGVATPLTTQPMGEVNGPACGYPNLDGRGYLFVIQLQALSRWDGYVGSGQSLGSLGSPAILAADRRHLYVRDDARKATVVLLAPGPGADPAEVLQRLAAIAYPATH